MIPDCAIYTGQGCSVTSECTATKCQKESCCFESDADGTFFIIPYDSTNNFEKIVNDHVVSSIAYADSLISNLPAGKRYVGMFLKIIDQRGSVSFL